MVYQHRKERRDWCQRNGKYSKSKDRENDCFQKENEKIMEFGKIVIAYLTGEKFNE